ncbi:cytochrome C biogenesis protein [Hyphomicrobium nitrativorans NL23]|uniref:Cytochrome c-type biogenesis protein n=1 Tax=Hyphomicrobium nitrativorans NL23 TaxID=1029756 RepID=V5SDS9_9HYPH|nr:cytochrome c-type biogenesis protein [Hyphomicrobium nitrativorans]AHB49026.1 cytochrome C biogenesis protein [Hyphomicrobium nitrativorans NL23]
MRFAASVVLGVAVLFAAVSWGGDALALQPDEILSDAALEKRARGLSAELRCLVCQNQSIDDSDAPLARDLRLLVRERLVAGDTDTEVRDFVVARYGEFVLLKPPFSVETLLLWFIPLLALLAAVAILWSSFRAGQTTAHEPVGEVSAGSALTPDEQAKLDALLAEKTDGKA